MPRLPLHLIPTPKSLIFTSGTFKFPPKVEILLPPDSGPADAANRFAVERFIGDARRLTASKFRVVTGKGADSACAIRVLVDGATVSQAPNAVRDQAYRLAITPDGIQIAARAAPGIFYAFQTLRQIIREAVFGKSEINQKSKIKNQKFNPIALPCVEIEDFPDFARRGVYHDTARGKVPTVDTLLQLINDLAHLKFNEFQLYIENNFEFCKHPEMYNDTDPLTAEELQTLDAACRARHIDFVPSLTSLGHFEKILSRPAFRHLAEAEPAQLKAINAPCWFEAAPWSLCVTDPGAKDLLKEMYDEFLPNFTSPYFNICCDEAYDLGAVRSKAEADRRGGIGPLYLDWINTCSGLAQRHKKSIQLWGDIILNHPDLISRLPEDVTLLEWGYEHDHKFEEHCALFAQRLGNRAEVKGLRTELSKTQSSVLSPQRSFYVAPGTSSWLTFAARTKNAFANIHNAAAAGLKHGAAGLLVTDWGDNGHQQMLAVSLAQIAYAAAASWNLVATPNPIKSQKPTSKNRPSPSLPTLLRAMSIHFFQEPAGKIASLAYDLGLTYERLGWQRFNASLEYFLFREKWEIANFVNRPSVATLRKTIAATEKLYRQFHHAAARHPNAKLIAAEFLFTCLTIIHACRRTLVRQQWLAADPASRNPDALRPGAKNPRPFPRDFKKQMQDLGKEAILLKKQFSKLWLIRNKPSRLRDMIAEFDRLAAEYQQFS